MKTLLLIVLLSGSCWGGDELYVNAGDIDYSSGCFVASHMDMVFTTPPILYPELHFTNNGTIELYSGATSYTIVNFSSQTITTSGNIELSEASRIFFDMLLQLGWDYLNKESIDKESE